MLALQRTGELFVHLVTHPTAWRGFLVYAAFIGLLALARWRGGWAEQLAAGGSIVQFTIPFGVAFAGIYWPGLDGLAAHFATDVAFLVVYLPLILYSRRIWPLWFYAFNLLCPLTLTVILVAQVGREPYAAASWLWMTCAIAALALGVLGRVLRDPAETRARTRGRGADAS
ncbi:hypothetical protein ACFODL_21055 [Phenylobacterium terrae]|uniref:Uncharacterized protein n=1 Tax=Phenylobacterium terrae TaxID=2665495 RepID=A0ABW4N3R9_9CAUL